MQFLGGLLKRNADTRFVVLDCALHEELHSQQGLSAAGISADQSWSAARQTPERNLIETLDSRGTFRNPIFGPGMFWLLHARFFLLPIDNDTILDGLRL